MRRRIAAGSRIDQIDATQLVAALRRMIADGSKPGMDAEAT